MSMGGTKGAQQQRDLEDATTELQAELDLWQRSQINPHGWRMGDQELMIRCEILTLMEILKEKLGIEDIEFQIVYKKIVLAELRKLRPKVQDQRSADIRNAIISGINVIKPEL